MSEKAKNQNEINLENEKIPAEVVMLPEGTAITAIKYVQYDPYDRTCIDTSDLLKEILKEEQEIEKGDLKHIERYLYSQAIALHALFDRMLAQSTKADFTSQVQLFGTLALKAQAQCRATLATLAQIKSPDQITFIKQLIQQQNNAIQVNNSGSQSAETKKIEKLANELLSEVKHEKLERGGTKETITTDPEMAALERIYRSEIA